MTNKKLTGREALAYMATGGWFTVVGGTAPHVLQPDGSLDIGPHPIVKVSGWTIRDAMIQGITPCPDPTVTEYETDKDLLIEAMNSSRTFDYSCKVLIQFIEKHYQRKEVK